MFVAGCDGYEPLTLDLVAEELDPFCLSLGRVFERAHPGLLRPSDCPTGAKRGKNMASVETADRDRMRRDMANAPRTVTHDETKPSFKTTELLTMLGVVAAILIAAASADNFDAPRAWTLVAVVASAYMVARGLAKSGSRHLDSDH